MVSVRDGIEGRSNGLGLDVDNEVPSQARM